MKKEKANYNYRKMARLFLYGVSAVLGITVLTCILNIVFFLSAAFVYVDTDSQYIGGGKVMEALTPTQNGYELDRELEREFEQKDQWAMLLDEKGRVIWSVRKPEELKDAYTEPEIARMSKWYLQGYPVQMRVWDDRIMIVGMQKETMWKYNIEFTLPWMGFVKRAVLIYLFTNFIWIVALAFLFTKRYTKNRERARIEWIAGISHDIRTPLSLVMGYADTLEHSGGLTEDARQQAAVIRRQSMVMKELIADLNLTSRLEYSMQALRKEKVRPAEIVRSVAVAFLNDSLSGEVEIDVEISPEAEQLYIKADRQLFVRVFRNLINNSMKHSGRDKPAKIRIVVWRKKKTCCIRLEDDGMGYSEDVLRRLHSRRKTSTGEHIRGLEIVKKIILAHGGKIRFGNAEKGGGYCLMTL